MVQTYLIKNKAGDTVNTIVSSLAFVQSNFEFFEELKATRSDLEIQEKTWRDNQLKETDWIVPITDHSQHARYLAYRQALRDWPATPDFPDTRPVAP